MLFLFLIMKNYILCMKMVLKLNHSIFWIKVAWKNLILKAGTADKYSLENSICITSFKAEWLNINFFQKLCEAWLHLICNCFFSSLDVFVSVSIAALRIRTVYSKKKSTFWSITLVAQQYLTISTQYCSIFEILYNIVEHFVLLGNVNILFFIM